MVLLLLLLLVLCCRCCLLVVVLRMPRGGWQPLRVLTIGVGRELHRMSRGCLILGAGRSALDIS